MVSVFVGDPSPRLPASVSARGASVASSPSWCININLNATSPAALQASGIDNVGGVLSCRNHLWK